jgi:hypothetical protein
MSTGPVTGVGTAVIVAVGGLLLSTVNDAVVSGVPVAVASDGVIMMITGPS